MADSYTFKVHLFELLRDPQQWAAFSENVAAAQHVARGWGIDLQADAARALIVVLSRFQQQVVEATADFVNAGFSKDDHVLMTDGIRATLFGVTASGIRGGGGGPHYPPAWEWHLRIDGSGMAAANSVG
jgi:hypothetical protein